MPSIGVIGCGTVGACLVAALAARAEQFAGPNELVLVDRLEGRWRGRAYQRDTEMVLANGPMIGMSLHHNEPEHGVRWAENKGLAVHPDERGVHRFLPRPVYGDYLVDGVEEALASLRAAGWTIRSIEEMATGVDRDGSGVVIHSASETVRVDHAVLCLGGRADNDVYGLRGTPGYIDDPYPLRDALAQVPADAEIAVIGSGMIATDVLVALRSMGHRGRVTLASRSGLLPSVRRKAVPVRPSVLTAETLARLPKPLRLADIGRLAEKEVSAAGEDFAAILTDIMEPEPAEERLRRQLADALSPGIGTQLLQRAVIDIGQDLWLALHEGDKERVLRTLHSRLWSFASPIPQTTAATLVEMYDEKRLCVRAGIETVERGPAGVGFRVRYAGGEDDRVSLVINAVTSVYRPEPPAAGGLLGLARTAGVLADHPHGGIRVEEKSGKAVDPAGQADERLFVLGELTRGAYYFVSAVAAFTRRADEIAASLTGLQASADLPAAH
ncbi:FAD/NAD(P)-binding protein [Streptomyces sp. ISL-10]|uniref:FAD/NAD(P)-binding protein n=1 Tax=Streptomyces sp. ISL-10 TaxID=2819172 RepID=UPI001BE68ACD|nr:FAD/NAD(P)-binding protein [Streptomyces sp. ISL-10]MBT2367967.1 FAD/NAD(P)-binding protein [Streptomyces sp. ISL-10]